MNQFPWMPRDFHDHLSVQLALFDVSQIPTATWEEPLPGWSLTEVRALAIDPDLAMRFLAAESRWNWDVRLQRVLATDPDERVVLHLLDHVDPYVDVCELIIAGPHAMARHRLLAKNLRTELLEKLAGDVEPYVSFHAERALAERFGLPIPEVSAA